MARGINKVILVGNLGQDPETRYMPSGAAVTNFTVATNESWKDKQTGEQKDRTEWHRVAMFNRLAEIAAEYLRKGSQVYIEGRMARIVTPPRSSPMRCRCLAVAAVPGGDRLAAVSKAAASRVVDSRAAAEMRLPSRVPTTSTTTFRSRKRPQTRRRSMLPSPFSRWSGLIG